MSELEAPFEDVPQVRSARPKRQNITVSYEHRLKFIRTIYSLLSLQFTFSLLLSVGAIASLSHGFGRALSTHAIYITIPIPIMLATLIFVGCFPNSSRRQSVNYSLLAVFSICKGFVIAILASVADKPFQENIVFMLAVMFTVIAYSLAIYSFTVKKHFQMFNGGIAVYVPAFVMLAIFFFIESVPFFYMFLCFCGAVLFGIVILLETKTITEADHLLHNYSWGTMALYLGPFVVFWACVEAVSPVKHRKRGI